MRTGLYALYDDSEFEAELLANGKCRLSADLPFEGFERRGEVYEKTLEVCELAELFAVSATVDYMGETLRVQSAESGVIKAIAQNEAAAKRLKIAPNENGELCVALKPEQISNYQERIRVLSTNRTAN